MYAQSGLRLERSAPLWRELALEAADAESLLVLFLSELLHFIEHENLAFDRFEIALQGFILHARLRGVAVGKIDKEIKAVTYHNLQVQPNKKRLPGEYRLRCVEVCYGEITGFGTDQRL